MRQYICIRPFLRIFGREYKVDDIITQTEYDKLPYLCQRYFKEHVEEINSITQ